MHIMGCMTIDMRHVTGDWVTFNDFALPGNMPHGNNYDSLICMKETWFAYQEIHNDNDNIVRYKPGL